ncbi:MAG TPA: 50S ribosomal protein L13 [Polyangia bacterium]|jgi:large subunit ribosomal protein L13|nr:50S ribosomal protein L13 [Polyangia bacterium]
MIPKTKSLTKEEAQSDRKWHVVDVAGMTLGRAATQIAHLLRGKHKPTFTPNQDCGDFVIVINASKVTLTGNKMAGKMYYRHTGFPGGIVGVPAEELLRKKPQEVIERAVWGMLPKGPLGRRIHKKLKVYANAEHPHAAQQPAAYKLSPARRTDTAQGR